MVVPTLDRPQTLARAIGALMGQTLAADQFELIVAEDARNEATPALRSLPFAARAVKAARDGASAARNAGWRSARAPTVLFIGDDIIASPGLLAEHLAWHEREPTPDVAVLGAVDWAREVRRSAFTDWLDRGIQFDYRTIPGVEAGPGHFYSANVSLKRATLSASGGFDEVRFPFLYEDIELGTRLFERGLRLLFNAKARAEHLHQPQLDEWRERVRLIAQAERRWVALRPDKAPYFHDLFAHALARPRSRGRWRRVVRLVPRRTPLIGTRAWTSVDLYFRQQLATAFMDAWHAAD